MIMQYLVDKIEREYNPEFDVPAEPQVTWTDMCLLEIIQGQQVEIDELKKQIGDLTAASKGYEAPLVHPEDNDAGSYGEYQHIKAQQRS